MKEKTWHRLLQFLKPQSIYLVLLFLISIVSVTLTLFTPVMIGRAIDLLIDASFHKQLITLLFQLAIMIIVGALMQLLQGHITNIITYQITMELRNQTFIKIQSLPLKYIDNNMHGDLLNRIINDIDLIGMGLLQSFTNLFTGIVTIVGTLVIMFVLHAQIAFMVMVLTPLSLFVASWIARKTYHHFQTQLSLRGELGGYVEEMITGQVVVKAFGYEKRNEETFQEINQRLHTSGVISQFLGALINPTTRLLNSFVYATVGIFGALNVVWGSLSVGLLSSFLTYANQYTKPFNEISSVMSEMQTALAAASRIFRILDQEEDELIQEETNTIQQVKGKVEIKDLSFSYEEDKPLIEHMNLSVSPGEMIAIVGKTGCGKTTLINLLMRFYEPLQGSIYIDDQNILTMKKDEVRKLYGMVLQDSWLFHGTIKENIAFGSENASDEEIITAAKLARAHKFIEQLPHGYDTYIEEDGGNISKGQQQLICIARIILKDPSMLILDEATSSIDTRTELQIQNAFDALMKGRTTFIVAHRLSTIKHADSIIVMDDGHIVEQGKHQELLDKKGYYHDLYYSQFDLGI